MTTTVLPAPLAAVVQEFAELAPRERLQLLLELADDLPDLPEPYAGHRDRMEPVPECQSPVFLATEVDDGGRVRLFLDAPRESPTTRGFAGILHSGLDGASAAEVLAVPDDFYLNLRLAEVVSLLRLRGMAGMLARIKRQVREKSAQ